MNDGIDKNFNLGIGNFVTKLEIYTIKNLFLLSKLLKRFSFLAFLKLKNFIQFLFSKANKPSIITILIITIITIKIIQWIKKLINLSKKRLLNLEGTTIKGNSKYQVKDTCECIKENINRFEITNKNVDTTAILNSYTVEQNKIEKSALNQKILKINKSLELQNKIREKNNLPKENLNSPFYNILKVYISNDLYKN